MNDLTAIKEYGKIDICSEKGNQICCVEIIGEIEGHDVTPSSVKSTKYEHLIPIITGVEFDADISGLVVILHTTGGDVDAGLAIAELISTMKKPTVSLTLGTSHSIGIPIAVSTDYSFITKSGLMLAHPIRMTGTTIGSTQSYLYIQRLQNRITEFITSHCQISKEDFCSLINNKNDLTQDIGSMINGPDSVKFGLINEVGGLKDAVAKIDELILHKSQN